MLRRVDQQERPSASRFHSLSSCGRRRTVHPGSAAAPWSVVRPSRNRASEWLFFKGGMSMVLILSLMALPAVAAVIGVRMDGPAAAARAERAQARSGSVGQASAADHVLIAPRNH